VAAAANGSVPLLVLGLAISVPLIVAGAALIMALLAKLPVLVWAGAALLGWIAGEVIATDPGIAPRLHTLFDGPFGASLDNVLGALRIPPQFAHGGGGGEYLCAALGVVVVLVVGFIWRRRSMSAAALESSERHAKASAE
jgi:hypothetical protein